MNKSILAGLSVIVALLSGVLVVAVAQRDKAIAEFSRHSIKTAVVNPNYSEPVAEITNSVTASVDIAEPNVVNASVTVAP